jgi:hypothetical protein
VTHAPLNIVADKRSRRCFTNSYAPRAASTPSPPVKTFRAAAAVAPPVCRDNGVSHVPPFVFLGSARLGTGKLPGTPDGGFRGWRGSGSDRRPVSARSLRAGEGTRGVAEVFFSAIRACARLGETASSGSGLIDHASVWRPPCADPTVENVVASSVWEIVGTNGGTSRTPRGIGAGNIAGTCKHHRRIVCIGQCRD